MIALVGAGIGLLGISLVPYAIYLWGIYFGKKEVPVYQLYKYPPISVVISAYNEEQNIKLRIENLVDCGYSDMEVVFVDDCSTDHTFELAEMFLALYFPNHKLLHNEKQMGTSASYNRAIRTTSNEIVVVTDADVRFKKDALFRLMDRLMSNPKIGAVSGDLQPEPTDSVPGELEEKYRSVYGMMCQWESAHGSTFNFNGALMAFRKSAEKEINDRTGADDTNVAFAVIRNGYRAVYEKTAVVYEKVPGSFTIQTKQKIRRASGLIRSTWANRDLADRFYLMRFWMWIISPALFFAGLASIIVGAWPLSFILIALIILGGWLTPMGLAFVVNQAYLLMGLLIGNKQTWESTSSLEGMK